MRVAFFVLFIGLVLSSCRKADRDYDSSILASSDQTMTDVFISNIFLVVDEAVKFEYGQIPSLTTGYLDCPIVTSNLLGSPRTVSIDFGTGCTLADGRVWKGQIYITIDGTYGDSLVIAEANLLSFSIDEFSLSGSVEFTDQGVNEDSNSETDFTYTDLIISHSSPDWTAYMSGSGTRELISDGGNFDVSDDEYSITGSGSSISRSGNPFTHAILTPISFSNSCRYVTAGTMDISPDNLVPRVLEYGDGTCDSNVVVNINQTQFYVALP